ncbi:MAG: phasin family protein [Rhodovibrionaceae bacterium]|nr:phasin family protein [Rhodovibrionaceae bacterium]
MSTQKKTTQNATKTATEAMKPVEEAVTKSKEQYEAVVKAGTDAATKNYETAVQQAQEQMEKASKALFGGYDELASLNKDNMDAFVKSSNIYAKGFESLSKEMMSFAQSAMETNLATVKAFAGAKTVREVIDLQADYARSNFDKTLAESAKLTEMSVKVTNDAMEPIQGRVNVTVQKMLKPVAA